MPTPDQNERIIRPCDHDDAGALLSIINAAAKAYHGVIPADCWHEPYMSEGELHDELAAGVGFIGCEIRGALVGVMGIQRVRNVDLIRHAYVQPAWQGHGIGHILIEQLRAASERPLLVGTWLAATWAIRFYQQHGFQLVPEDSKARLLAAYWTVSPRQIATSVVLASPAVAVTDAMWLIERGSGETAGAAPGVR
ncbi:MAG: GNAT family N-acetyltransferase [Pseudomonadota bacterium]|uniref:GNAT family N-acetyltransferase n=1 Tax=Sphingomonas sp. ERG5 TaxID=1381597 RepID=UPI000ADF3805|nr:GNAT family N-acetyltransferase [Sphingomonas sp. ERG5]